MFLHCFSNERWREFRGKRFYLVYYGGTQFDDWPIQGFATRQAAEREAREHRRFLWLNSGANDGPNVRVGRAAFYREALKWEVVDVLHLEECAQVEAFERFVFQIAAYWTERVVSFVENATDEDGPFVDVVVKWANANARRDVLERVPERFQRRR